MRKIFQEGKIKGEYRTLVQEMMLFDDEYFCKMFPMFPSKFEHLFTLVGAELERDNTRREAISPGERLCVTLRFLTSGDSFTSIACSYRMSSVTVGRIVKNTCKVLWETLLKRRILKSYRNCRRMAKNS